MSIRRHLFSQEIRYQHPWSPRKSRTYAPGGQFQPTWLYHKQIYRPYGATNIPNAKDGDEASWIGKIFIPEGSIPSNPSKNNYIREYDVMKKAGTYSYRILYAVQKNGEWVIKSKASVEGRPGQMNLIMSPKNEIIDIQYW